MDAATSGAAARGDDRQSNGTGRDGGDKEKKDVKKVSLLGMFRYADRLDVLLMVVGAVGAVANGVAEPLVTVLFGNVIDSFGESTAQSIIRKVVLNFVYLGIGSAVVSFLLLRQDIAFFDTELTTGQAVSRMSSDTLVIQDALGEKAGKLLQLTSSFFGGFIIAFTRGWLLTLVMLTSLPLVAIAGAVAAQLLTKVSSNKLTSYGDAGDTVEQTIGAIQTVVSFNGENKAVAMYKRLIKKAYRTDILEGLTNGFGMGSVFCILFCSYGLAFWYGGKLIVDKAYTGGKIITVLFAVLTGPHDALVKDPNGAYSQLIRLQETRTDEKRKIADSEVPSSRSKSTSLSLRRSLNKDSFGNSNRYSFKNPQGLSVESYEDRIRGGQITEEPSDVMVLKKAPIRRLFKLNMPEVLVLLLGSIAASVHGVIFPLFGILMSGVIKSFYEPPDKLKKDTSFWALISVVLGVGCLISVPAEYFLFAIAGGKLIERIRTLTFQSILPQEVAWFDKASNSSGALGTRLSVDALNIRRLAGDNLALIVQSIASLTTGFVIAFSADWRLALIITTVASFCAEKRVVTTYDEKCEALRKQGIRSGIVGGLGYGFSFLVLYLTYGLCFYVGAQFVRQGKTTFPDVFKVFFALVLATIGVSQASALASDATKARDSAISIFSILDRKSKIDSSSDDGMVPENVTGNIDFNNVSFKYPSRPDVQIFSDFTLHIPSGKTVALVGESGSGKSTIIALLERFYDPDSGGISLDGVEIKSLKVSWLRDQMGLVGQEPVLFNDTIRVNITYGKSGEEGKIVEKGRHEALMRIKGGAYASLVELRSKSE
ncbi:hypothetical protein HU200_037000 [Digitaria exilis]|uniref:ABC transmembrane type-1 domain-containing protein n=1 Tax=Digitaria exilis TaxID=1010633 RepID=A0A835BFD5_9POAL|nr:hypothetical protein HU200_037000 [Digitaria exilis]